MKNVMEKVNSLVEQVYNTEVFDSDGKFVKAPPRVSWNDIADIMQDYVDTIRSFKSGTSTTHLNLNKNSSMNLLHYLESIGETLSLAYIMESSLTEKTDVVLSNLTLDLYDKDGVIRDGVGYVYIGECKSVHQTITRRKKIPESKIGEAIMDRYDMEANLPNFALTLIDQSNNKFIAYYDLKNDNRDKLYHKDDQSRDAFIEEYCNMYRLAKLEPYNAIESRHKFRTFDLRSNLDIRTPQLFKLDYNSPDTEEEFEKFMSDIEHLNVGTIIVTKDDTFLKNYIDSSDDDAFPINIYSEFAN